MKIVNKRKIGFLSDENKGDFTSNSSNTGFSEDELRYVVGSISTKPPVYKRNWFIIVVFSFVVLVVGVIFVIVAHKDSDTYTSSNYSTASPSSVTESLTNKDLVDDIDTQPANKQDITPAMERINEYLNLFAFSEKGMRSQLEFDGFTEKEIDYALNHSDINWNMQAVNRAGEYDKIMGSMSSKELLSQLEFDGFTSEQAQYGVEHTYGGK